MAESHLRQQLESVQLEICHLCTQVPSGRPTAPKDLSLVSYIPKWPGTEKSVHLEEFFETIETTGRVGNLTEADENLHIVEAFGQHHGGK
jgi:hypothetical protein